MALRSTAIAIRAHLADRATRLIAAAGASLLVCLTLLGAYLCADLRGTAWHNARRDAGNLLSIIEEGVGHSVRNYDRAMREAARLAMRPDVVALEPGLRRLALFDVAAAGSGLGPMAVTDATGHVVMTSDPNQKNRPDLSDLPEFAAAQAAPQAGLILTGPTRSRLTGQAIIRLTRRIETPDGAFAGIVTVATSLDSIRALWVYKAAIIAILILCLNVLTLGLTVLLHREVGRRAAAEADTRETNAALTVLARTDGLTGLPNRRSYDERVASEWRRAAQLGVPLALLIVDADHFKQFNDWFGHQRGDDVLRAVAECLRRTYSSGGLSFRIGGEGFVVLLPALDATAASDVAERVRRSVVNLQIAHAPEVGSVATVSIGVASAEPGTGGTPDALFVAADAALYAAKKAGRNRVRTAPRSGAPALQRRA